MGNCMLKAQLFCSEEVTQRQLNKIRDVVNHERLDEELYHDHETEEARKVSVSQVPIIAQSSEGISNCVGVGMQKRTLKESKDRERLKKQLEKVVRHCCKCLLLIQQPLDLCTGSCRKVKVLMALRAS